MPGPLLAVDAPSLLYRAFFALPKSIKGADGRPVNALLGMANLVLQAVERYAPRATVLCFGAEAAAYRVEHFAGYHADRPEMPDAARAPVGGRAGVLRRVRLDLAARRRPRGRRPARLAGAGRDAPPAARRCCSPATATCSSASASACACCSRPRAGRSCSGPDEVRARYGIEPAQVPDFIALRGDPSDGIPGAKGIGEKGAAELLRRFGDLDGVLAAAARRRAR